MGWQLWTAFGIFIGFAANVIVENTGKIAWRLQLGTAFIPTVPSASSSAPVCTVLHSQDFFSNVEPCSESPRWLMKKNRYPEAYHSLVRLRHTELQAARDLYYIHVQLQKDSESKIIPIGTYFDRLTELFINRRVRRATLASFVVMLAQQLCGINSKCIFIIFFILANTFDSQLLLSTHRQCLSKLVIATVRPSTPRSASVLSTSCSLSLLFSPSISVCRFLTSICIE